VTMKTIIILRYDINFV